MWFREYYGRVFPAGKGAARTQLRRTIAIIAEHPEIGRRPEDIQGAFEYPITRTPFTVIYRVQADELQILRIYDQRSDFSNERNQ